MSATKQVDRAQPQASERFAALDLLRGLAALSVLLWHSPKGDSGPLLGRAYLSVDLFFVLSGFVLAHAHEMRLRSGGHFGQFCLARLIRLYPLYLAATLMSAAFMLVVAVGAQAHEPGTAELAWTVLPALLFLPTPPVWSVEPKLLYPLAFTAWSLLWELLVNLLYGAGGFRLRGSLLAIPLALGAIGIVLALARYSALDGGWEWDRAWCGAPRALFSFFAGVAIFRVRKRYRAPPVPALLVAAILIAALVPSRFGGAAYEAACVFLLFPLLVWFGADALEGDRVRSAGNLLGYLSYPIYLVQAPVGLAIEGAMLHLGWTVSPVAELELPVSLAVTIVGSWLIARFFDSPMRESLRARFLRRTPKPAAQTAP